MAKKDPIPTSRVARSAKLGRLAAGQAVRQAGTRAANLTRDDEGKRDALARRQLETAEQIVTALGTMKGAAMKIGQVMSFLDVGLGSDAMGFPLPGYSFQVVDPETGRRLPAGRTGELLIRGPGVTSGYWGDAGATAEQHRSRLRAAVTSMTNRMMSERAVRASEAAAAR